MRKYSHDVDLPPQPAMPSIPFPPKSDEVFIVSAIGLEKALVCPVKSKMHSRLESNMGAAIKNVSVSRKKDGTTKPIYHRVQGDASTIEKFDFKVKNFDTREPRSTTIENPAVNSMQAFDTKPASNLDVTKRLVANYNHQHKHGKDADYLHRLSLEYLERFQDFNLCRLCKNPVKVVRASIDVIQPKDDTPEKLSGIRKRFKVKRQRHAVKGVAFVGQHWNSTTRANNFLYADIVPHYEIRMNRETGKMSYVFVIGQGIELTQQKGVFYLGDAEYTQPIPSTYRVFNRKCNCK